MGWPFLLFLNLLKTACERLDIFRHNYILFTIPTAEASFNTPERHLKMMDEHPDIVNRVAAYHISA